MWNDLTFLLYIAVTVVSLYGFVLFLWWWTRTRTFKVGPVYAYVTFLLLGLAIDHGLATLVRAYRFISHDTYTAMHVSWWWPARTVLLLACISLIVLHMSWRIFAVKEK